MSLITMRGDETVAVHAQKGAIADQARTAIEDLPQAQRYFVRAWGRRRLLTGLALGLAGGVAVAVAGRAGMRMRTTKQGRGRR